MLSSDKPLADPNNDKLGYMPFAKYLADGIAKMTPPEGLVIGVYAPWGMGKTTVLNFVKHFLEQKSNDEQPIIMHFNPWWFDGHENLTKLFFSELHATLDGKLDKAKRTTIELLTKLNDLGNMVSKIPTLEPIGEGLKSVGEAIKSRQTIVNLKKDVEKLVTAQEKRILIIIDDIDRLSGEETTQLFRVIKAVADFPNVIYLLTFDRSIVAEILRVNLGVNGFAFLEKIVQVPFELPIPDKIALQRLLTERLNMIIAETPTELFDSSRWLNVYKDGLQHFIRTPRDIVRLINTLSVTYPPVINEVNGVDFIAIEALRVFRPEIYDFIRNNQDEFTKSFSVYSNYLDKQIDKYKEFHQSWLNNLSKEESTLIKELLLHLFPNFDNLGKPGLTTYDPPFHSIWRKERRICNADTFEIYFRLGISEDKISRTEMLLILNSLDKETDFIEQLSRLANKKRSDGVARITSFLDAFDDHSSDLSESQSWNVIQAFMNVGDALFKTETQTLFGSMDDALRARRIIYKLLSRFDLPLRFKILKKAMEQSNAVSFMVEFAIILGQHHGQYEAEESPDEKKIVNLEQFEELKGIILDKVRNKAGNDHLLNYANLTEILTFWRYSENINAVEAWVSKVTKTDENLVEFLEKFLQKTYIYSVSGTRIRYRINPQWVNIYLDTTKIIDRVKNLTEADWLNGTQQIALLQFVVEYECRQSGLSFEDCLEQAKPQPSDTDEN